MGLNNIAIFAILGVIFMLATHSVYRVAMAHDSHKVGVAEGRLVDEPFRGGKIIKSVTCYEMSDLGKMYRVTYTMYKKGVIDITFDYDRTIIEFQRRVTTDDPNEFYKIVYLNTGSHPCTYKELWDMEK